MTSKSRPMAASITRKIRMRVTRNYYDLNPFATRQNGTLEHQALLGMRKPMRPNFFGIPWRILSTISNRLSLQNLSWDGPEMNQTTERNSGVLRRRGSKQLLQLRTRTVESRVVLRGLWSIPFPYTRCSSAFRSLGPRSHVTLRYG